MSVSVKTNQPALIALQNLNKTNDQLSETQNRINTGLKIAMAKDNASIYAIAQKQRASISSLSAVTDSLNRATSIADVASAAGQSISDILNTMRQKVVAAMDPSIDAVSRNLLDVDYKSLLRQVSQVIQNANFDGANILDGSLSPGIRFIADANATTFVTLSVQNMSLGGAIISMPATASITTVPYATSILARLDASIIQTNSALAKIGAQANQISAHNKFVGKLSDALNVGVGNLVDADMAAESARLQALQVQQQLGAQALSIANQAPQVILQLFK
ncbi:MAG: flagellin [Caulobacterales bacterium 32-69-10]|nr:MAG: flagellin [Caulobacterales bacterium 32-69-10]